jgi:peroxiredoxin
LPSTRWSAASERGAVRLGLVALVGLAVVVVVAVAAVLTNKGSDSRATPTTTLDPSVATAAGVASVGSKAPLFDLDGLHGGRVSLAQLRGQPVVVNFWASYCFPCRNEFATFKNATTKYRAQGLHIVGITFDDLTSDARAFAKQQHANWILADGGEGDPVGKAYGVRALPQTIFIGRQGTIIARYFGAPSAARFDSEVRRLLASA